MGIPPSLGLSTRGCRQPPATATHAARCCARRPCPALPACPHALPREHVPFDHTVPSSHCGRHGARAEITLNVLCALSDLEAGKHIVLYDAIHLFGAR